MPDLTTLARAKFNNLSKSELRILNLGTSGEYGPSERNNDPGSDLAQAGSEDERTIRAITIRPRPLRSGPRSHFIPSHPSYRA